MVERPQAGELADQVRVRELEQPLGAVEVLEPVLAELRERGPVGKLVLREDRRGLGQQDLAAVTHGTDPGGAMDLDPDIAVALDARFAGMDRHPDPDRCAVGPVVGVECLLRLERAGDGIGRAGEGHEERVALRVDLDAVPALER